MRLSLHAIIYCLFSFSAHCCGKPLNCVCIVICTHGIFKDLWYSYIPTCIIFEHKKKSVGSYRQLLNGNVPRLSQVRTITVHYITSTLILWSKNAMVKKLGQKKLRYQILQIILSVAWHYLCAQEIINISNLN